MKPTRLPIAMSARPSEKARAESNCGFTTILPERSMYPQRPPTRTAARFSKKLLASSNCGLMTYLPFLSMIPVTAANADQRQAVGKRQRGIEVGRDGHPAFAIDEADRGSGRRG